MRASFAGGVLHSTDYFSSRDRDEGRAWLVMHLTDWHVLLPDTPGSRLDPWPMPGLSPTATSSDGWRWRLELGRLVPPACHAARSSACARMLPDPYSRSERTFTLYTSELKAASGQSFFGSVQLGVQIHTTCRLWLVRDTRRGEKAHDQQRRLERFREQRPGGL
jgi:hypothetical protein